MGNRKEKKQKNRMGAWIGTALVLLGVLILLSVNITEIKVTGNRKYTPEQIEDLLFEGRLDELRQNALQSGFTADNLEDMFLSMVDKDNTSRKQRAKL